MDVFALPTTVQEILPWREMYRREMDCQIVHDSLHAREGWTRPYLVLAGDAPAGYGSIVTGGPWAGNPTIFEFYVQPRFRLRLFDLFDALLNTSGATGIEAQTNDALLTVMLHAFAANIRSEKILFRDSVRTTYSPSGVVFRPTERDDAAQLLAQRLDPSAGWVVTIGAAIAGAGGILFHYNRPYGDIFMEVAEPFRRRGLGVYLVQELKRVCYEGGSIPAARCNSPNIASRKTLQKAGFTPCGHILTASVSH